MITYLPDAIALSLGPLAIHWYGIFLVSGVIAALLVIRQRWPGTGRTKDQLFDLVFVLLLGGLLGARLYYVIYAWSYYVAHLDEIIQIWRGGLAIHGAWIGGLVAGWLYSRRHHWQFWPLVDRLVIGLPLGQAIGRWGNYFNQELFGRPTTAPWGIPIDLENRPVGLEQFNYFHPTFLYESVLALVLFGLLLLSSRSTRPVGEQTAIYVFGYSLIRFLMEFWRIDYSPEVFGVRWAQIFSAAMMVGVVGWWAWRRRAAS